MLDSGFRIQFQEEEDFRVHIWGYLSGKDSYICQMTACKTAEGEVDILKKWCSPLSDCEEKQLLSLWEKREMQQLPEEFQGILKEEKVVYHKIWQKKREEMAVVEQDFNDFLNWRIHQIEFFYGAVGQAPRGAAMLSMNLGISYEELIGVLGQENMQYLPMVTSAEEYSRAYFPFLEQQVRSCAARLLADENVQDRELERAAAEERQLLLQKACQVMAYILVESCHGTLKKEFLTYCGAEELTLNNAGTYFKIPEQLYFRIADYLQGIE